MEHGRFTPREALKRAGQLTLLATALNFLPQTVVAQESSSDSIDALVDCSVLNGRANLRLEASGTNLLTIEDVESGKIVTLTAELGSDRFAREYRGQIVSGDQSLDLLQGKIYRINFNSSQAVSSASVNLECMQ